MMYYLFIALSFAVGLLCGWAMRNAVVHEKKILSQLKRPGRILAILYSEKHAKHVAFDLTVGTILGLCFAQISSQVWMYSDLPLALKLVAIKVVGIIVLLLVYLAVYDLLTMEIPAAVSYLVLAILICANAVLLVVAGTGSITLWQGNEIWPLSSFAAGITGAFLVGVIVVATKERGMGAGDIFLAAILGLALGLSKSFVAFYVTILSATAVGLVVAFRKGTLKNVPIPFVPFIVFGILITFLFWNLILPFLQYSAGLSFLR